MKRKFKIFLVVLSVLLIMSSLLVLWRVYKVYKSTEERIFDSYLIVADKGGVGLVPGVVFFGMMMPGDSSTAKIYLNSTFEHPVLVKITSSGDIKNFFVDSEHILWPYENKSVDLSVVIPKNASYGRYDGKVVVTMRKMLF